MRLGVAVGVDLAPGLWGKVTLAYLGCSTAERVCAPHEPLPCLGWDDGDTKSQEPGIAKPLDGEQLLWRAAQNHRGLCMSQKLTCVKSLRFESGLLLQHSLAQPDPQKSVCFKFLYVWERDEANVRERGKE